MRFTPPALFLLLIAFLNLRVVIVESSVQRSCKEVETDEDNGDFYSCKINGDFLIGGLFPLHRYKDLEHGENVDYQNCDILLDDYVIQQEAFLYYLNIASDYLERSHNFSLGTFSIDTCYSSEIGFRRSVDFIKNGTPDFCQNTTHNFATNPSMVITGGTSDTAQFVKQLLEVYCIPFFATDATYSAFSDHQANPYFLRVLPANRNQAEAIIALLKRFKWNHVGVIYEDTLYSRGFVQDLNALLKSSNLDIDHARKNLTLSGNFSQDDWTVCIEWAFEVPIKQNISAEWETLRNRLDQDKSPRVLLVLMDVIRSEDLFDKIEKALPDKNFQLIAGDGWTDQVSRPHSVIDYAIGTEPMLSKKGLVKFEEYVRNVTLQNALSPWLKKLIQRDNKNCSVNGTGAAAGNLCHGNETLNSTSVSHVGLLYADGMRIAVQILNETLDKLHREFCSESGEKICTDASETWHRINGSYFMDQLLNHSFFNGTNSGAGGYDIYYFRNNSANWTHVGQFTHDKELQINDTDFKSMLQDRVQAIDKSIGKCFSKCPKGYPMVGWSGSCCWNCQTCNSEDNPFGYIKINNRTDPKPECDVCLHKPSPHVPSENLRGCDTAPTSYIIWGNLTVYLPFALALAIFLLCFVCFGVVVSKRKTPIVQTSGILHNSGLAVLGAATTLTVLIPLGFRVQPGIIACSATFALVSVILAANQTLILLKTTTLCCSITVEKVKKKRSYTSRFVRNANAATVVCSCAIQVMFLLVWFMIDDRNMKYFENPNAGSLSYTVVCSELINRDLIVLFMQPSFLILVTLTILVKFQRQIDTHFKLMQHRYLMGSTFLAGLLMIIMIAPEALVSKVTKQEYLDVKLGCLAGSISFLALCTAMPVVKLVWMILFQPQNNDDSFVNKELSAVRDAIERFKIDKNSLLLDQAKRLGEGHFAWVIQAVQKLGPQKTRPVAIKKLKESANKSESEKKKFFEEAFHMSQLDHKNIVLFFGTCQTETDHLLVMEYVDGGSMDTYLKKQITSQLQVGDLIGFCKDVSEAGSYLESKKMIHRDIRAENCLMKTKSQGKHGPQFLVKLSDFGLARDIHCGSSYKVSAFTLAPIRHTAPEGFDAEFTLKSDVWSFGVLIWQVFHYAAEPLNMFADRELHAVIVEREQTVLDHDHNVPQVELPAELLKIMEQCLCWEPEARPSFKQVAQRLGVAMVREKKTKFRGYSMVENENFMKNNIRAHSFNPLSPAYVVNVSSTDLCRVEAVGYVENLN